MELDKEKKEGKACFLAFLLISMMHGGGLSLGKDCILGQEGLSSLQGMLLQRLASEVAPHYNPSRAAAPQGAGNLSHPNTDTLTPSKGRKY